MDLLMYVLIGLLIGRYLLPMADLLLELINYGVSKMANSLNISTQREQLKFEREAAIQQDDDSPRIGFEIPNPIYEDDEDEIEERRRR